MKKGSQEWKKKTLLKAADIIDTDGFCQFRLFSEHHERGPVCIMGALNRASQGNANYGEDSGFIEELLNKTFHTSSWTLVLWNNEAGRTAPEVSTHLREMAKEIHVASVSEVLSG